MKPTVDLIQTYLLKLAEGLDALVLDVMFPDDSTAGFQLARDFIVQQIHLALDGFGDSDVESG